MEKPIGPVSGTMRVLNNLLLERLAKRYEEWLADGIAAREIPAQERHKDYLPLNLWDDTQDE